MPPTITLTSNLWIDWAQIAIRHARRAREVRVLGVAAHVAGDQAAKNQYLFMEEVQLSLVACTAAAFAVAGIDGVTRPLVPPAVVAGWATKSEHDQIRLALEYCYACKGTLPATLVTEFKWLFGLVRNPGVHHKPTPAAPVTHPVPGVGGVSAERALYLTEQSERAIEIMLTVVELLCSEKLAKAPGAKKIANDFAAAKFDTDLRAAWMAP